MSKFKNGSESLTKVRYRAARAAKKFNAKWNLEYRSSYTTVVIRNKCEVRNDKREANVSQGKHLRAPWRNFLLTEPLDEKMSL